MPKSRHINPYLIRMKESNRCCESRFGELSDRLQNDESVKRRKALYACGLSALMVLSIKILGYNPKELFFTILLLTLITGFMFWHFYQREDIPRHKFELTTLKDDLRDDPDIETLRQSEE